MCLNVIASSSSAYKWPFPRGFPKQIL
jgi:hypothetical protein